MNIEPTIIKIISKFSKTPINKIKNNSSFIKDFEFDSLVMLELVAEIEQKLAINIKNEDLYNITTVDHLLKIVHSYIKS